MGEDLVAKVKAYEAACNRYVVDVAVDMYAEDGVLEARDTEVSGRAALCAAHGYDEGAEAIIAFEECRVDGNSVTCRSTYTSALDRALDTDGWHTKAVFTFKDGLIERFASLAPDAEEIERHHKAKERFVSWAKSHAPELWERSRGFDYDAGAALTALVRLWEEHQVGQEGVGTTNG